MKKVFTGACALALSAALFTGCGCSNSSMEPTMMPTNATMAPTTHATTAPTTRPTTAPTTMPTTEAPTQTAATEMPGSIPSEGAGTSTEATGSNGARNRMPAQNEK